MAATAKVSVVPTLPLRIARFVLPFAVAATVAALPGPHSGAATASGAAVDSSLTGVLHSAMDARRRAHGLDPLFSQSSYVAQAETMARTLANGGSVQQPADGTPASWVAWNVLAATVQSDTRDAAAELVDALDAVLRYPLHTDGGWAAAVANLGNGYARIAVTGLVGWARPNVGANAGCSGSGYCWSARGLNPHLPWTRNRLPIHLSSAGAPAAADSLLKAAIARINAAPGLGADVVYGGRTSATDPGAGHRFLVQWRSTSACGSSALGCTLNDTQGSYKLIFGSRITILSGRYYANPSTEQWVGTLTHELGHALGLGHYGGTYGGHYQLMKPSAGPHSPQSGDVNGLRTLDRAGSLAARLTPAATRFHGGSQARMTVRTRGTGLGGVRSVTIQCLDARGVLRTIARRTGAWDILGRDHVFTWTVGSGGAYTSRCRALVTSKLARTYSASVTVTFGG